MNMNNINDINNINNIDNIKYIYIIKMMILRKDGFKHQYNNPEAGSLLLPSFWLFVLSVGKAYPAKVPLRIK